MMQVHLVFAPAPRQVVERVLTVAEGSTVREALEQAGWRDEFQLDHRTDLTYAIWNHKARLSSVLKPLDRVEIHRPLRVDPKLARRERFSRQGARTAGLFARQRAGAKPGY